MTTTLLFTLGALVLFWILKYNWNRRWLYYYASKIDGPFGLPLIGSLHLFWQRKKDMLEVLMDLCKKYEPIMKIWIGNRLLIIPTKPKDVHFLLSDYMGKPDFYKENVTLLIKERPAPVEQWKKHKKVVKFTFNHTFLNSYVNIFVKHANSLVNNLIKKSGEVDLLPHFSDYTLLTIIESCLGVDPLELEERNMYFSWFSRFEDLMFWIGFNPLLYIFAKYTTAYKKAMLASKQSLNFIKKIVEKKRKESSENSNIKESSFLGHLLKIADQEGKWTNEEVIEESQRMVFAASETTRRVEGFVILMLAMHPDIQDEVYKEILTVFGNSQRNIDIADLNQLTYLECVIKETMRLFPVAYNVVRSVEKDIKLDSCVIPKGSSLLVPVIVMHRNSKYWSDPLKFNPNRFRPEEINKHKRFSYIPFSLPPKDCIGKKFAMMTMKVVLATVLRSFRVTSCSYKNVADVHLYPRIMLNATHGCKVTLQSRIPLTQLDPQEK